MADDPNRDVLPVREGSSCVNSCRSNIDPRERHLVCKLDRYQLEDRYLRLLEEVHGLKKLSNDQEDKIKRLATKLMRVSANPGGCVVALEIADDKERIEALELENAKLKNKITVLRNQLLSYTMLRRSPPRCRRPQTGVSSGPTTCRSETGRSKTSSCRHVARDDNSGNDVQNYLVKIKELDAREKETGARVADLEAELATLTTENQCEKITENVEYIRMWRQTKQWNDKLTEAQNANEALTAEIRELKKLLEEATRNNREITTVLVNERKRLAEIDDQLAKAKDSRLLLREKEEQIRDLTNETKILQQHNGELISLSAKYAQVELENVALKRKVSEQLSDHLSLKSAFGNEQANIAVLRTVNEQLLEKLRELQRNMDDLTVQLKSIWKQNEIREESRVPRIDRRNDGTTREVEEVIVTREKGSPESKKTEERVVSPRATNPSRCDCSSKAVQTEIPTTTLNAEEEQPASATKSPIRSRSNDDSENGPALSHEKMLKLLEQARINTPLDTRNADRIRRLDASLAVNRMLDLNQGQRQVIALETLLFGNSSYI